METKVVNIYAEKYEQYIGRGKSGLIPINPRDYGYFGNPFSLKDYKLQQSLDLYTTYFYKRLEQDETFKNAILSLKGKILGCFCKPKRCHGDIIKEWLDAN